MRRMTGLLVSLIVLAGILTYFRQASVSSANVLHLYIWSDYIDPAVLQEFKATYNIEIIEENFSSNEELEGKLQGGAEGYDILVPSDYMVKRLIAADLLAPLPKDQIPNLRHLSERFRNMQYDPGTQYSVPYMWGTTGIGYNISKIPSPPKTWAQFFDPEFLKNLEKRVSLLDDPREVIGAALKSRGYSLNSQNPSELTAAKHILTTSIAHIGRVDANSYKDLLGSGDLWLVQGYIGDIAKLRSSNPDIHFLIPADGSTIWADNLVIPKASSHKDLAAKFIDFIMRPDINARIAQSINYATTNEAAIKLLPSELTADPNIYPGNQGMKKLEWLSDLGEQAATYDQIWNEVKAGASGLLPGKDEAN